MAALLCSTAGVPTPRPSELVACPYRSFCLPRASCLTSNVAFNAETSNVPDDSETRKNGASEAKPSDVSVTYRQILNIYILETNWSTLTYLFDRICVLYWCNIKIYWLKSFRHRWQLAAFENKLHTSLGHYQIPFHLGRKANSAYCFVDRYLLRSYFYSPPALCRVAVGEKLDKIGNNQFWSPCGQICFPNAWWIGFYQMSLKTWCQPVKNHTFIRTGFQFNLRYVMLV